jgi:hypothetical protein
MRGNPTPSVLLQHTSCRRITVDAYSFMRSSKTEFVRCAGAVFYGGYSVRPANASRKCPSRKCPVPQMPVPQMPHGYKMVAHPASRSCLFWWPWGECCTQLAACSAMEYLRLARMGDASCRHSLCSRTSQTDGRARSCRTSSRSHRLGRNRDADLRRRLYLSL